MALPTETLDLGRFLSVQFFTSAAVLCVCGSPVATFTDADKAREFANFMEATFDALTAKRPSAQPAVPAFTMETIAAFAGFRPLPNDF